LRSFNILPFAYEHFLSKLSPAIDMEKFWANPDKTLHKYKTIWPCTDCYLIRRVLGWNEFIQLSLNFHLSFRLDTKTFKPALEYLIFHPFLFGNLPRKNFCHYKTCMKQWRWFRDLLFSPTAHALFTTYLHML
jgi:hypothetical protein